MTEAEWLNWSKPHWLISFIADPDPNCISEPHVVALSERRLRLYLVGCCRRQWDLFSKRPRRAVGVAEACADGKADVLELEGASQDAHELYNQVFLKEGPKSCEQFIVMYTADVASFLCCPYAELVSPQRMYGARKAHPETPILRGSRPLRADGCLDAVMRALETRMGDGRIITEWGEREQLAQTELLRCVTGNPFRPVTFSPSWRTSTAVALAAQMYESRDFGAMPILADALQDAGCDIADVLDHCRGPGPHVRGCWVVDLVLGKE